MLPIACRRSTCVVPTTRLWRPVLIMKVVRANSSSLVAVPTKFIALLDPDSWAAHVISRLMGVAKMDIHLPAAPTSPGVPATKCCSNAARITSPPLVVRITKDVAAKPCILVAVRMVLPSHEELISKGAVAKPPDSAAVTIKEPRLGAPTLRDATAGCQLTAVVPMVELMPKDLITGDAIAALRNMAVAPMAEHRLKDPTTEAVIAARRGTAAVPMDERRLAAQIWKAATAGRRSTVAVPMNVRQPRDPGIKDVHVEPDRMGVVSMVLRWLLGQITEDALEKNHQSREVRFLACLKSHLLGMRLLFLFW